MKILSTRVPSKDYEDFNRKCQEVGVEKAKILRLLVWDFLEKQSKIDIELENLKRHCLETCEFSRQLLRELKKISANINQISRSLNILRKNFSEKDYVQTTQLIVDTINLIHDIQEKLHGDTKENTE
jgi:RNAse (barnase) inhibitor barstar